MAASAVGGVSFVDTHSVCPADASSVQVHFGLFHFNLKLFLLSNGAELGSSVAESSKYVVLVCSTATFLRRKLILRSRFVLQFVEFALGDAAGATGVFSHGGLIDSLKCFEFWMVWFVRVCCT